MDENVQAKKAELTAEDFSNALTYILGSVLEPGKTTTIRQDGSRRYTWAFRPGEPMLKGRVIVEGNEVRRQLPEPDQDST